MNGRDSMNNLSFARTLADGAENLRTVALSDEYLRHMLPEDACRMASIRKSQDWVHVYAMAAGCATLPPFAPKAIIVEPGESKDFYAGQAAAWARVADHIRTHPDTMRAPGRMVRMAQDNSAAYAQAAKVTA